MKELALRPSLYDRDWEVRKGIDSVNTPVFDSLEDEWDAELLDQLQRESMLRSPFRRGTADTGQLITVPVRFAAGDGESKVDYFEVGVGTVPGQTNVMPLSRSPQPIHVALAPHPDWKRPEEYDSPGVYNAMRVGQYIEAWLRIPTHEPGSPKWYSASRLPKPEPTAQRGLFVIVKVYNKAGVSTGLVGEQPVVHDVTPPVVLPRRVREGYRQDNINSRF